MFNFIPQLLMVVFNRTRDLLVPFFTLKLQQQWKHFSISIHNIIFAKIHFRASVRYFVASVGEAEVDRNSVDMNLGFRTTPEHFHVTTKSLVQAGQSYNYIILVVIC
jgi:hypothetical protein